MQASLPLHTLGQSQISESERVRDRGGGGVSVPLCLMTLLPSAVSSLTRSMVSKIGLAIAPAVMRFAKFVVDCPR